MPATQRKMKSSDLPPPTRTLIIDNGAHTLKAGFASSSTSDSTCPTPTIIPNCLARDRDKKVYIGSQLSSCKDYSEIVFRRPIEKGYLVNWEAEKAIWEHEFFDKKAKLHCDPKDTGLILTEAPNALPQLQMNCDQVVFEEFGFARYLRCTGAQLNAYHDIPRMFPPGLLKDSAEATTPKPAEILMLIDTSYSHTTITPLLLGRPVQKGIHRLDVGGKLMTNLLTRLLSVRQYDMRNETHLVNEIKEATCYVSQDFNADMDKTWKGPVGDRRTVFETGDGIAKDYVLPDYRSTSKGIVRAHQPHAITKLKELTKGKSMGAVEDVLTLRNERFTVPEVLFNPSDIGLRESGIPKLVMDSLSSLPMGLWPGFLANVVVVGGNANIPGMVERLESELRALAPEECIVRVAKALDPVGSTWLGGVNLAQDEEALSKLSVTKEEYEEHGSGWTYRKFGGR